MYGVVSVLFVLIVSLIYYQSSTYSQLPFEINQIQMGKLMKTQDMEVLGTCIDKSVISKNPLLQIKLKSHCQNTFAVTLNYNSWLKCSQLLYAFNITKTQPNQIQISLEDLPSIKTIVADYEVKSLQKDQFLKVKNQQLYVLVLSVIETDKAKVNNIQTINTITLAVENQKFSEPILKPLLLFGLFNLIGISLIAYYKKNVFKTRVKLLSTVTLLVYLMWIGFDAPSSLEETQQELKIAMTCFLLIICIKNHLNTCQTSLVIAFSFLNQFLLSFLENSTDNKWSLLIWLVYALNFINASFITRGQNIEVVYFSMFGFATQYGLVNQNIDIMHPMVFSLILVTLLFGPTILQVLELKQNFENQTRKTRERLQSYELSESDTLFHG